LRISIGNVLLHAQKHLFWLVLAVTHVAELGEVVFGGLLGVAASISFVSTLLAASLELDLGI
jgi:hypothetical protein